MTKKEWFTEASGSRDKVKSLIKRYHPIFRQAGRRKNVDYITAPNAEAACSIVRKQIQDSTPEDFDPVEKYQDAIDTQNVGLAMKILNETWFGVPESTLCWEIIGFPELIRLCEDSPDDEEE